MKLPASQPSLICDSNYNESWGSTYLYQNELFASEKHRYKKKVQADAAHLVHLNSFSCPGELSLPFCHVTELTNQCEHCRGDMAEEDVGSFPLALCQLSWAPCLLPLKLILTLTEKGSVLLGDSTVPKSALRNGQPTSVNKLAFIFGSDCYAGWGSGGLVIQWR